jgi:hypothetical protein
VSFEFLFIVICITLIITNYFIDIKKNCQEIDFFHNNKNSITNTTQKNNDASENNGKNHLIKIKIRFLLINL